MKNVMVTIAEAMRVLISGLFFCGAKTGIVLLLLFTAVTFSLWFRGADAFTIALPWVMLVVVLALRIVFQKLIEDMIEEQKNNRRPGH